MFKGASERKRLYPLSVNRGKGYNTVNRQENKSEKREK